MSNTENLLEQVRHISRRYNEIAESNGEKFNVFDILRLDEKRHSRFIGSLLNPDGTHGKGNAFLNHFLDVVEIKFFSAENANVEIEKFIGNITEEYDKGGRIDIAIADKDNEQIFIENKIDAGEQSNQLLRYHNSNKKANLLYLTLDGRDATEYSTGKNPDFKYVSISYEKHIIKWLELCEKESIGIHILHETLRQYIILIKKLTNQTRSEKMSKDIVETITKNADNFKAAFEINQALSSNSGQEAMKKFFITNLAKPLAEWAKENHDLEFKADLKYLEYRGKWFGISFAKPEWGEDINIRFQFFSLDANGKTLDNLCYGLWGNGPNIVADIAEKLKNKGVYEGCCYENVHCHILVKKFSEYKNLDFSKLFNKLDKDNEILEAFKGKINEMMDLLREVL